MSVTKTHVSICTNCGEHIGVIQLEKSDEGIPISASLTVAKTVRLPDPLSVECPGCRTKVDIVDSIGEEIPILEIDPDILIGTRGES